MLTLVWILCWTLNQRLPRCNVLTVTSVAAIMIAMFFLSCTQTIQFLLNHADNFA